jgi:hypothetical protein
LTVATVRTASGEISVPAPAGRALAQQQDRGYPYHLCAKVGATAPLAYLVAASNGANSSFVAGRYEAVPVKALLRRGGSVGKPDNAASNIRGRAISNGDKTRGVVRQARLGKLMAICTPARRRNADGTTSDKRTRPRRPRQVSR